MSIKDEKTKVCVFNQTRESFLSLETAVADTHWARLAGLMGRRRLRAGEGLWVVPCQGIHTVGLMFPIDVVYLDAQHRVIDAIEHLSPFRLSPVRMNCSSVLELPVRTIYTSQTRVDDELLICSPGEMEIHWRAQQLRRQSKCLV